MSNPKLLISRTGKVLYLNPALDQWVESSFWATPSTKLSGEVIPGAFTLFSAKRDVIRRVWLDRNDMVVSYVDCPLH